MAHESQEQLLGAVPCFAERGHERRKKCFVKQPDFPLYKWQILIEKVHISNNHNSITQKYKFTSIYKYFQVFLCVRAKN